MILGAIPQLKNHSQSEASTAKFSVPRVQQEVSGNMFSDQEVARWHIASRLSDSGRSQELSWREQTVLEQGIPSNS